MFAALFLSIGLAFSPSLQIQFTLPKLFWLRVCASSIGVLWWLRLRAGAVRPIPSTVLLAAAALAAWWTITLVFAVHRPTALWGMPGRYNGFVNQITLLLLFLAVSSMRMRREDVARLAIVFVMALVPPALYAVAQGAGLDRFAWPNPRPGSTIGHPVPLAAILSLGLPFALAFSIAAARWIARTLWIGVTALLLFAVGTTLSRGPWAGAAVALAVVVLAVQRSKAIRPRQMWLLLAAIALAATATAWFGRVPGTRVSQRVTQLTTLWTDPSFVNRFVFFRAASAMVRDHPVTGVGFESFALLYPRYRPVEGEAVPEDTVPSMVHNGYLQLAVTTGVPGLLLYLSLMAAVLRLLWRTRRTPAPGERGGDRERLIAAAFAAAIAGYLVQDLSGWSEISLSADFWTIAGLAVAYAASLRVEEDWEMPASGRVLLGGIALAASLATGALAHRAFQEMNADREVAAAGRLDVTKSWPDTLARLTTALAIVGDDPHYLDEAALVYLRRLAAVSDESSYRTAAALFERAASINRFDPYILIHRIDLEAAALRAGLTRAPSPPATAAVATALDMDRNNSSVHAAVARFDLAAGRPADASTAIDIALTLRPRHVGYRVLEGDIRRAMGQRALAIAAYRSELGLHQTPDDAWVAAGHKLTAALIESADYRTAVVEGRAFVARMPRDATGQVLLGIAYRHLNDLEAARTAFAAAAALDPIGSAALQGLQETEREMQRVSALRGGGGRPARGDRPRHPSSR